MRNDLQLYLGEDRIPVIRWVNRFGSPVGRDLRFTIPLEAKSKLEANPDATYTLRRHDEAWDFEVKSLELHTTGTNGVRAIGRVKGGRGLGQRSSTAVGVPDLGGSPSQAAEEGESSDGATKADENNADEKKAKRKPKIKLTPPKKSKKKKERSGTAVGAPVSEAESEEE